jgi:hypothetical protein
MLTLYIVHFVGYFLRCNESSTVLKGVKLTFAFIFDIRWEIRYKRCSQNAL